MIDVLYLCHGRLEFTQATLPALMQNTDWSLVNELVVYNDAAPDHPRTYDYLREVAADEEVKIRDTNLGSPVAVMNHFLARSQAEIFAKIDNDIVVPPGWLNALTSVMEQDPDLELLGMEPGMSAQRAQQENDQSCWTWTPSSHIGGVGLMRRSAFDDRPPLVPDGRFGFTEWQHEHTPLRGWIEPDLRMFALDQLPFEPWLSLTARYVKKGLNREWGVYSRQMSYYWDWWEQT
jgi:hypothetical protein